MFLIVAGAKSNVEDRDKLFMELYYKDMNVLHLNKFALCNSCLPMLSCLGPFSWREGILALQYQAY